MASTTVKVDGLRDLGLRMESLKASVSGSIARRATGAAARVIKKQAVKNIETSPSIETRSLHDSVIVKAVPKKQTTLTSEHVVTVRGRSRRPKRDTTGKKKKKHVTTAPHAIFVEFGTVNMPAEPFLKPAFEDKKMEAVNEMKRALERGIKNAINKKPKK